METAIDVQDFPGHARGVVAEKEGCGFPNILASDLPAQGGDSFLKGQLGVQPLDGRGGQGLDGSGAENVDADSFGAEVERQVARRRFQGCLGHSHDFVGGECPGRAQIGEGENGPTLACAEYNWDGEDCSTGCTNPNQHRGDWQAYLYPFHEKGARHREIRCANHATVGKRLRKSHSVDGKKCGQARQLEFVACKILL